MLSYQLIRSNKRKTVGLQVKYGNIIIRAPQYVSEQEISHIVDAKSAWLQKKVAEQKSKPKPVNNYFQENSQLLIKGELKNLQINYGLFNEILIEESSIHLTLSNRKKSVDNVEKAVKKQLEVWFKKQLTHYIDQQLSYYAEQIGVLPKSFKVRFYKARWGSCNSKGELSFSSLLAMTPHWVIDYVIVHELCHLVHMNHSREFWQLVTLNFPNYLSAKHWLKEHQNQLHWPS
jgi:predicted metal-dependent hydrolase